MPWDDIGRVEHRRDTERSPSDLTDREWAIIAPLLPPEKMGGRKRTTDLREVMNGLLYIASSDCPSLPGSGLHANRERGRMLPKDFPPMTTVQGYFYAWRDDGLWLAINHTLVMAARELEGREASPTAGVIPYRRLKANVCRAADSQSVKTTESGGVCGYDALLGECSIRLPGNGAKKTRDASATS